MQAKKYETSTDHAAKSLEESISLWLDGEQPIDADQLDTPYGRQVWDTYHLIGDVLRTEELAIEPSELFYARLCKAIDDEPTVFAPNAQKPVFWRRASMSLAALGVAMVASWWVMQPATFDSPVPVLASADDMWGDYIDAHRSATGLGPASYASYTLDN